MKTRSQKSLSRTQGTILFLILAISIVLPCVQAAPGDLDTTFNAPNGFNTLADTQFNDVAIQPGTGKSLALGTQKVAVNTNRLIVARYNTDGSLDTSFGTNGIAAAPFNSFAQKMALQNGKIVAVGVMQSPPQDTLVVRFEADGQLDMSFGQNGIVTSPQIPYSGMAVGPDSSIVFAGGILGKSGSSVLVLAKLTSNGALDTSFGSQGFATTESGLAFDVAVLGDGKILAGGSGNLSGFTVWRYNSNGTLDTSFGGGTGIGHVALPSFAIAFGLAVQPDGRIVLAGVADSNDSPPPSVGVVARFDSNGNLDASFNGGTATVSLPGVGTGFLDVAVQSDGAIVAVGTNQPSSSITDALLSRFTPTGALDSSFGNGGNVTTDFPGEIGGGRALAIQGNGKIVIAGNLIIGNQVPGLIARYNGSGAPPPPPPPSFNFCVDKGSFIFKLNSTTGAYEFRDCAKGFMLTGTGTITVNSCKIDLLDTGPNPNHPDRNVQVRVNPCTKVGTVTLTTNSPAKAYGYTDNDITQGSCTCP